MANKTLYVRDKDEEIWEKARKYAGESLSSLITNHLKDYTQLKEAESLGFERIILRFREQGKVPTAKAFSGRWLISPEEAFSSDGIDFYAIAITPKNNFVIFNFFDKAKDEIYQWGIMKIVTFDELRNISNIPDELIIAAIEKMGVEIEELDI